MGGDEWIWMCAGSEGEVRGSWEKEGKFAGDGGTRTLVGGDSRDDDGRLSVVVGPP